MIHFKQQQKQLSIWHVSYSKNDNDVQSSRLFLILAVTKERRE